MVTLSRFFNLGVGMLALLSARGELQAQENRTFAKNGITELGGSISIQHVVPVTRGETDEGMTTVTIAPFIGYFITDGFELGVNPFGITSTHYRGSSSTQFNILIAPSYNFNSGTSSYPFVEALFGYTMTTSGTTRDGFSWGGRGGVKVEVVKHSLLNLGVQYLQITQKSKGATGRNGSNQFSFTMGFTMWVE